MIANLTSWITGHLDSKDWNLDGIVNVLITTQSLFQDTNFDVVSRMVVRMITLDLKEQTSGGYRTCQKRVLHHILPALKNLYGEFVDKNSQ
jgi:hypothetical protein